MFAQERRAAICELVNKRARCTVRELQRHVKTSGATLRRDLAELDARGEVIRVHGGVVHPAYLSGEPTFDRRAREAATAKRQIAKRAAGLVRDRASVFLDAGTTCLEIGRRLLSREDLKIFTNSVKLLTEARGSRARLECIGGQLREVTQALVGSIAFTWIEHLRFDYAFIGASGLHPEMGPTTTETSEAAVKKAVCDRAASAILVADSRKWDHPAPVRFAEWSDFSVFITDHHIEPLARKTLRARGLQVLAAGKDYHTR